MAIQHPVALNSLFFKANDIATSLFMEVLGKVVTREGVSFVFDQ